MQSKARFVRIHNSQAAGGDIYIPESLLRSSQEDVCMLCVYFSVPHRDEIMSYTGTRFCEERGEECAGYPYPSHAAR
jgi:hypothetical protein